MEKENVKTFKKFFVLLGFFIALISAITTNVEARDFADGVGGTPTSTGVGYWLVNEDTSSNPKAFERFLNTQVRVRGQSITKIKSTVNGMGSGATLPNGNTETLVATCNRSQFVWWYGESAGNDPRWPKDYWYTLGGGTHNIPDRWQTMSDEARESLKAYKQQSSNWTGGKVVLICSASYTPPPPVEVPITIRAKSKTVTYDGNNHTVSGYNITAGSLKSGHKVSVTASKTAKNVGSYPVPVSSVKMTDSNGKDVTSEYKITTREGTLRINPKPTITGGQNYRCITHETDTASAIVQTVTTGSHGYTPNGVGNLRTIEAVSTKDANGYKSSVPSVNSSISTWNNWKRNFQGGSNSSTPEINLENGGVSGTLSTHGGVYNVLKTLRIDTYTVEHCQPQTRHKVNKTKTEYSYETTKNPDGSTTTTKVPHTVKYQEWSAWEDSGERKLTTVSNPVRTEEHSNYQILSVNCNLDGFNTIKNQTGGDVIAIGNGDGSAALKTPAKSGRTTGNLGKSGATSTSSFYTDGDSCDIFTCTVAPNASVLNDAKNNKANNNLFGEVLEGNKVGETNEDGELVFFRDNEDRQVRADLWYPKATGLADLDAHFGTPAKDTFVKVYDDSTSGHVNPTPEIQLTTIAPWNNESNKVGLGDIGRVKKYSGEINRFNMKSQWASEDGAPYQLGVNWEYKATGKNRIPAKVNGERIVSNRDYSKNFDIHCEFRNNSSEYKATIPDRPYAQGGLNASDTTWTPSNAIRALFSRSASAMD